MPDKTHGGPVAETGPAQDVLPREPIVFGFLKTAIALNREVGKLGFLQIARERRCCGIHFNRVRIGNTRQIADLLRECVITTFQFDDALLHARRGQVAARHFNRQFLVRLHAFARHTQNFLRAHLFLAQQVEGMPHLGEFQISDRCAHDYVIPRAVYFQLHALGMILGGSLLGFQHGIEN